MITPTYPGVYVREESSGARAVAAAATSVAAFVGMAEQGRMDTPVRVFNLGEFENEFGTETSGELSTQVRQFFLNGGGQAWIVRIADGDQAAEVVLEDEQSRPCLTVTARDPGLSGNLLRVEVDYDTASPERTFNLSVYRSNLQSDGTVEREDEETYNSLSMNPNLGNYVESVINGASSLVTVTADQTNAPNGAGVSYSGLVYPTADAALAAAVAAQMSATANAIRISVDNNPPIPVTLGIPAAIGDVTGWATTINDALANAGLGASTVAVDALATGVGASVTGGRLIRITSANGPVEISPAASNDVSVALAFGATSGGLEGDEYGDIRPAPSGVVARIGTSANGFEGLRRFASAVPANLTSFTLNDDSGDGPHTSAVSVNLAGGRMYDDGATLRLSHTHEGWTALINAIENNSSGNWDCARHGYRLVMKPQYGGDNTGLAGVDLTTAGYNVGGANEAFFDEPAAADPDAYNTNVYSVGEIGGLGGPGPFQGGSAPGLDGNVPLPADYDDAYEALEKDVSFNLLVLPRAEGQTDLARRALWGAASSFCDKVRAFCLVDPDSTWTNIAAAEAGVDSIRIGTAVRNSATYWPRLRVADGSATGRIVDPSGSIAGLMARTDGARGVWKAPAGLEATIRGVTGVETPMTDPENGVINPKALNAIRVFPSGVVSWGARTLVGHDSSGNIDDKYIPVRRTMLFIEESLYNGLQFAVFEPNDEPLWAQIRLAAGSFMNTLFRQGAFAGGTASDAYYVLCDSSTTTETDKNLGIVNVIVAFAPLKPAEFVILTVKQIAGQAQT